MPEGASVFKPSQVSFESGFVPDVDVLVEDLLGLLPRVVDARALHAEQTRTHELIHELLANVSKAVTRAGILEKKVVYLSIYLFIYLSIYRYTYCHTYIYIYICIYIVF